MKPDNNVVTKSVVQFITFYPCFCFALPIDENINDGIVKKIGHLSVLEDNLAFIAICVIFLIILGIIIGCVLRLVTRLNKKLMHILCISHEFRQYYSSGVDRENNLITNGNNSHDISDGTTRRDELAMSSLPCRCHCNCNHTHKWNSLKNKSAQGQDQDGDHSTNKSSSSSSRSYNNGDDQSGDRNQLYSSDTLKQIEDEIQKVENSLMRLGLETSSEFEKDLNSYLTRENLAVGSKSLSNIEISTNSECQNELNDKIVTREELCSKATATSLIISPSLESLEKQIMSVSVTECEKKAQINKARSEENILTLTVQPEIINDFSSYLRTNPDPIQRLEQRNEDNMKNPAEYIKQHDILEKPGMLKEEVKSCEDIICIEKCIESESELGLKLVEQNSNERMPSVEIVQELVSSDECETSEFESSIAVDGRTEFVNNVVVAEPLKVNSFLNEGFTFSTYVGDDRSLEHSELASQPEQLESLNLSSIEEQQLVESTENSTHFSEKLLNKLTEEDQQNTTMTSSNSDLQELKLTEDLVELIQLKNISTSINQSEINDYHQQSENTKNVKHMEDSYVLLEEACQHNTVSNQCIENNITESTDIVNINNISNITNEYNVHNITNEYNTIETKNVTTNENIITEIQNQEIFNCITENNTITMERLDEIIQINSDVQLTDYNEEQRVQCTSEFSEHEGRTVAQITETQLTESFNSISNNTVEEIYEEVNSKFIVKNENIQYEIIDIEKYIGVQTERNICDILDEAEIQKDLIETTKSTNLTNDCRNFETNEKFDSENHKRKEILEHKMDKELDVIDDAVKRREEFDSDSQETKDLQIIKDNTEMGASEEALAIPETKPEGDDEIQKPEDYKIMPGIRNNMDTTHNELSRVMGAQECNSRKPDMLNDLDPNTRTNYLLKLLRVDEKSPYEIMPECTLEILENTCEVQSPGSTEQLEPTDRTQGRENSNSLKKLEERVQSESVECQHAQSLNEIPLENLSSKNNRCSEETVEVINSEDKVIDDTEHETKISIFENEVIPSDDMLLKNKKENSTSEVIEQNIVVIPEDKKPKPISNPPPRKIILGLSHCSKRIKVNLKPDSG